MARKLTDKQEAYKNNRIKGMGVSASYRAAYDVKTMSDKSLSVAANKLEQDDRIAIEVSKSKQKASERALITVEDVVKGLMEETTKGDDDTTPTSRVSAWKALSDYTGGFDTNKQKVEHSGSIDTLSDEQLNEKLEALIAGSK